MTEAECIEICKAVACACMWGHGGIGGVVIENLQRRLPLEPSWWLLYCAHKQAAEDEAVGYVKDQIELNALLSRGYRLYNYSPGRISVHNPAPMGGLYKFIVGSWADELGPIHDAHNYRVYQERAKR